MNTNDDKVAKGALTRERNCQEVCSKVCKFRTIRDNQERDYGPHVI